MKTKYRRTAITVLLLVILAGCLVFVYSRHSRLYRVTILPRLGGQVLEPEAINDRGQVVGWCQGRFYLWEQGKDWRELGRALVGLCINNAGQIAGTSEDPNGSLQAFLWDPNAGVRMLGTLGGSGSVALGLNNRGQVVGYSDTANDVRHAFIWDSKTGMQELRTPGEIEDGAQAVNDVNQVFGYYRVLGMRNVDCVCYWNLRDGLMTPARPLPNGTYHAMNGSGHILGSTRSVRDGFRVFLWHEKEDITKLFSCGPVHDNVTYHHFLINDANQVAYGETLRSGVAHGRFERFMRWLSPPRVVSHLWDPKRGRVSLHRYMPRGTRGFVVEDMNNRGCIVGIAYSKNESQQTVLLEPIPERWGK